MLPLFNTMMWSLTVKYSVSWSDSEHKITYEAHGICFSLEKLKQDHTSQSKARKFTSKSCYFWYLSSLCLFFTFTTENNSLTLVIHRITSSKFCLYFCSVKIYWNNWIPGEKNSTTSLPYPQQDNLTGQKTHALHDFILRVSPIPLCFV